MKNFLLGLLIISFSVGCNPKKEVDLIVYNAKVYTVDADFSKATSAAIKDGVFVAVGDTEDIQQKYEANTEIDAEGKTIVPGLIDAHCH
ncbi:MAG: amidohydrolase, partial [Flavobacteriaceae bacterium]